MVGCHSWYQSDLIHGHLRVTSDDTEFPQVSFKSLQTYILSYFPYDQPLTFFATTIANIIQLINVDVRYFLINNTRKF